MASSSAPPPQQTKKLNQGLEELRISPLPFLTDLQLSNDDGFNRLTGTLIGPDGSDYEGGHFKFAMQFPTEYPFKPPEFYFITEMRHPNVDSKSGQTCHDQLVASWGPKFTLKRVFSEYQSLLANPNYDTPIENDSEVEKTPAIAREWTKTHAKAQA